MTAPSRRRVIGVPSGFPRHDAGVIEALLRELVAEVRGLRADLAARRSAPAALNRADRARLARMLPAIAGVYGSDRFAARDLVDADAPPALRLVTRGLTAQPLGSLFSRGAGVVIDGFVLERAGNELHATLWQVFRVPA